MTRKERETAKEVRAELKRHLSAGEKNITIHRAKIVTVLPQVSNSMDSEPST